MWEDISYCWVVTLKNHICHVPLNFIVDKRSDQETAYWRDETCGSAHRKDSILDGTPNLTKHLDITVGKNVKEQVESDLKLEIEAVAMYNRVIETAREGADNASRELFERLLKDEEEHVDWFEAQMHQMKELGFERYLSQQISEEE